MQIFVVKKLAEVQSFINLGPIILKRAGEKFVEQASEVAQSLGSFGINLQDLISGEEQSQVFKTKVKKTTRKLTDMMELYVGDEWDNPVEVLEWLSFYCGSAAAHAALVCGLLGDSKSNIPNIQVNQLADKYLSLLNEVIKTLKTVGRAQAAIKK